jgi:peptidoglycan/LPS O-acetylase OafA/YrhL
VAAVWVLLFHVCDVAKIIGAGWIAKVGVLTAGWVGVDLFFVLSGFVLMWSHGSDFAQLTSAEVNRFAVARVLRVYPLSLTVLALIAVIVWTDPSFAEWYRSQRAANLSTSSFVRTALLATRWVNGDGGEWNEPVWSLSVELVGYRRDFEGGRISGRDYRSCKLQACTSRA